MTADVDVLEQAQRLRESGVRGVALQWADNNGIVRSRIVPVDELANVAQRGVGASLLLAVFDSHDAVAHGFGRLSTASGDLRVVPDVSRIRQSGARPEIAYAPVDHYHADGTPSEYDARGALRRQIEHAAATGVDFLVGYELEFSLLLPDGSPAHNGPAYSPQALAEIGDVPVGLLAAFHRSGIDVGQVHAEYGAGQFEVSLGATDPLTAADDHLIARQIIHDVARTNGFRASFAPLTAVDRVGNGAHVHISAWRENRNLLAPAHDDSDVHGLGREGSFVLAGVLREIEALAAVGAPSSPSLLRLRPGYYAGSYAFWGVENRDAALRLAEGGALLGDSYWNIEFRPSDASGNPHLVVAALIASSLAGLADEVALPQPFADDPHTWSEQRREEREVVSLPLTAAAQERAIDASDRVRSVFTPEHREAFRVVRRSDAEWATSRGDADVVAGHLWLY